MEISTQLAPLVNESRRQTEAEVTSRCDESGDDVLSLFGAAFGGDHLNDFFSKINRPLGRLSSTHLCSNEKMQEHPRLPQQLESIIPLANPSEESGDDVLSLFGAAFGGDHLNDFFAKINRPSGLLSSTHLCSNERLRDEEKQKAHTTSTNNLKSSKTTTIETDQSEYLKNVDDKENESHGEGGGGGGCG